MGSRARHGASGIRASGPQPLGGTARLRGGRLPALQLDPRDQQRNAAELHGTIRVTEDVESGLLVLRDPLLNDVAVPATAAAEDRVEGSQWGGLSGALVFWRGIALGVVIEHHPRQGRTAITILPAERLAADPGGGDHGRAAVAAALGLASADLMPVAALLWRARPSGSQHRSAGDRLVVHDRRGIVQGLLNSGAERSAAAAEYSRL